MAVQYTNRITKTYYLREGKTKTGKPRYFFSTQQDGKGEAVEHIPKGYEIYEHPEKERLYYVQTHGLYPRSGTGNILPKESYNQNVSFRFCPA